MKALIAFFILSFIGFQHKIFAQEITKNDLTRDTTLWITNPMMLKASTLVSNKSIGFQASLEAYLIQKEINKLRKSGQIKTIKKDRFISLDLGYYFQAGLHHNWFLTGSYNLRRTGKRGIYAEFSPFIGINHTFISEETYSVDNTGAVKISKAAGNWYVTNGFGYGIGKVFNSQKNFMLKDLYAKFFIQYMYPNFGFIAIKPAFQVGTSFNMGKLQRTSKKTIKYK